MSSTIRRRILSGAMISLAIYTAVEAQDFRDRLISLVQLIANPTSLDQTPVLVKGYATVRFEGNALYLSEADARHTITRNAVWLELTDAIKRSAAKFDRRHVLVEGTFSARNRGHLGLFSGAIENISRFEVLD